MAVLLLYIFTATMGKLKYSYAFSGVSCFYELKKSAIFGAPSRILRVAGQSSLKPIEPGLMGKPRRINPYTNTIRL